MPPIRAIRVNENSDKSQALGSFPEKIVTEKYSADEKLESDAYDAIDTETMVAHSHSAPRLLSRVASFFVLLLQACNMIGLIIFPVLMSALVLLDDQSTATIIVCAILASLSIFGVWIHLKFRKLRNRLMGKIS